MTIDNDSYSRLAEKIGAPGYASYIKLLGNQLTPEEAEFLVGVEEGETNEQLAKRLNIDEKHAFESIKKSYTKLPYLQDVTVDRKLLHCTSDLHERPVLESIVERIEKEHSSKK